MRSLYIALFLTVGCGSGTNGGSGPAVDARPEMERDGSVVPPNDIDGGETPTDAATDAAPDAPVDAVNLCPAPLSFGTVTARAPQAVNESGPPADIKYSDNLDAAATPDIFKLVLIDTRGVFAGGTAPGSYTISGAETKYATCGACVEIFANVDASNNFAAFYLAQSGTLTITSVTPRLTGTLSNADLIHLNDDDTVNTDSCATHIDTLAFDVPVD
ncbi:MAG TPA: hypothetical protein VGM39_15300 [Kofleriaceae bacterium]